MIVDVFLTLVNAIIYVFLIIFRAINFVIPTNIQDALNTAFSGIGYFNTFFPFDVLITAVTVYLNFLILLYTFKIIRWAYAHIPWFGRHKKTPDL